MATPSLAMIPSAYADSKVYSVLPNNGDGDFTFDRASTATRVDQNGLIQTVAIDLPRLNYDINNGAVQSCPSLLLEPASTNLVTDSSDFSNSSWTKSGSSIVSDTTTSPGGTINADKLVEDTSNSQHATWSTSAIPVVANTDLTFSAYVKKADRKYIAVGIAHSTSNGAVAQFDLDTQSLVYSGDVGSIYTYVGGGIESFGNEWYKLNIVVQTTSTTIQPTIALSDDIFTSSSIMNSANYYTGDGTSGVYIWGAQLEQLSYATSYIPTTGAVQTRTVESCDLSSVSSLIGQTEGVIFVDCKIMSGNTINANIFNTNRNTSNAIAIIYNVISKQIIAQTFFNSINVNYTSNDVYEVGDVTKIAFSYKSGNIKFYINGVLQTSNTNSFTITSSMTEVNLADPIVYFSRKEAVKFSNFQLYTSVLTSAQLQTLTTL